MTTPQEDPPPTFHSHCGTCFDIKCLVRPKPDVACDMIKCPRECGSRYHACKADDHMVLCPKAHVSCTNAWYGCSTSKKREGIKDHLQHCPANIVMCGEEIHRENYHDHFCSEHHDHRCEPHFIEWFTEKNAKPIASALQIGEPDPDVMEQFQAMYPAGPKPEKQCDNKNENVEENKEVGNEKEGDNITSGMDQECYKDLHTVPWQYKQSLSSDANEADAPDPTSPDEVDAPSSPFTTEEPNLSHNLEGLPIIVLKEVCRYLDRDSLGKLAVTSKHLRHVCSSLLQEKGMVEMSWEKKDGSWQITKKIWHFGNMKIED